MGIFGEYTLSVILFLPMIAALVIAFIPAASWIWARRLSLGAAFLNLLFALTLLAGFDPAAGFQAKIKIGWIPRYGVSYFLAVDGLGLAMVLLTVFLTPLAILSSFASVKKHHRGFYASLLLLETGMLGVFMSLDLILFYVFWEAMLLPMYFIIGVWGGERRIYAAVKFILYTLVGSLLMLVGIMVLYTNHMAMAGYGTFNLLTLSGMPLPLHIQGWIFIAFFISFAIKVPLFPFHTWLPDAHVEAPTAGSVILAGVLLKMGAYGFFRFCLPLFPGASLKFAPWIIALALTGIIYGAFLALAQDDLKRLVAYSSISHLGFIVLGIFVFNSIGAAGALLQMVSHGLTTGALFMIVGMIYERTHTRMIPSLGGISKRLPFLAAALTLFGLCSMGLPGMSSFIGEFLIVSGSFHYRLLTGFLAVAGVVLAAVYILSMLRRTVFGSLPKELGNLTADLTSRELICLLPLVIGVLWLGIFPRPFLMMVQPSLEAILKKVGVM